MAGGVVFTAMQFGAALGLATVTTVLLATEAGGFGLADYQRTLLVPVIDAVVAGLAAIGSAT